MKLLQMPSIEIEPDVQDTSLPGAGDISVHEGPPPVTWQVVDEGTSRCKAKLSCAIASDTVTRHDQLENGVGDHHRNTFHTFLSHIPVTLSSSYIPAKKHSVHTCNCGRICTH